jgi:hypothetical protein
LASLVIDRFVIASYLILQVAIVLASDFILTLSLLSRCFGATKSGSSTLLVVCCTNSAENCNLQITDLHIEGTQPMPRSHDTGGIQAQALGLEHQAKTNAAKTAHSVGAGPLVCMQQPGSLLYVPERWFHATLNQGETLGFALQARVAQVLLLVSQCIAKVYCSAVLILSQNPIAFTISIHDQFCCTCITTVPSNGTYLRAPSCKV